jgi:hypothetical protein
MKPWMATGALVSALTMFGPAAHADDVSPASARPRAEIGTTWQEIQDSLKKQQRDAFIALCTLRYRRTKGENAYSFYTLATRHGFTWSAPTLKYQGNHAAVLVAAQANDRKWPVALLLDRASGAWRLDGLSDDPRTAEAYVENGKPLTEEMPAPPGSLRSLHDQLDGAYAALRSALFWRDQKGFDALASARWRKTFRNSAPYFWTKFGEEPVWMTNPRAKITGDRAAIAIDLMQGPRVTHSIGLLFVHGPRGYAIEGVARNEKQTEAFLIGQPPPE